MKKTCLSKSKLLMTFVAANTLLISAEVISSEHKPISVVGDYYMFGLSSSDPVQGKDNSAASGIARITLDWLALEDESTLDKGSFRIRVDHKHSYTEDSPSNYVMNSIGGFGLIQPAYSDIGLRLTNLYWKQEFNSQDTELMVGFLDSTDYVDTYALGNPYSGFSNLHFSTGAGAIAIPDESTFGASVRHMLSDNYYSYVSFSDAKADSTEPFIGVSNFFKDTQYFKSLELGWVPSKEAFYMQNSHLIVWHSDGPRKQASDNYGANWSTIYKMGKWVPFFRAGVAKGPEALYKSSVVAGTGYLGVWDGTLGLAVGWASPNASLDDTYNSEIYYRINFGPVSLTPNIQYINSLPFNSKSDDAWIFGLRGHINVSL